MKSEQWIVTAGVVLFIAMVAFALAPDKLWNNSAQHKALFTVVSPGPIARIATPTPQTKPQKFAAPADNNAMTNNKPKRTKAKPGMMNFDQAPTVRFSGIIQQITEMPQQDGQLHIWVDAGKGKETRVSIAPSWFLHYIGCTLSHDAKVSGFGFKFDNNAPKPLIYARKITLNGKVCRLRNDEGFALWSNRLR